MTSVLERARAWLESKRNWSQGAGPVNEARNVIRDLLAKVAAEREQCEAYRKANETGWLQFHEARTERDALRAEVERLRVSLEVANAGCDGRDESIAALLVERDDARAVREDMESERDAERARADRAEAALAEQVRITVVTDKSLAEARAEVKRLVARIGEYELGSEGLRAEVEHLHGLLERVDGEAFKRADRAEAEAERLTGLLALTQRESDALRAEVAKWRAELDEHGECVEGAYRETAALRAEVERLREGARVGWAANVAITRERDALRAEVERLRAEMKALMDYHATCHGGTEDQLRARVEALRVGLVSVSTNTCNDCGTDDICEHYIARTTLADDDKAAGGQS